MSCTILPVSRSKQMTNSSLPSSVAVVSQIWLPQITGEDQPLSWMAVFHLMFSVSLHRIGRPTASEWPSAVGPRNSGQLSPPKASAANSETVHRAAAGQVKERTGRLSKRDEVGGIKRLPSEAGSLVVA